MFFRLVTGVCDAFLRAEVDFLTGLTIRVTGNNTYNNTYCKTLGGVYRECFPLKVKVFISCHMNCYDIFLKFFTSGVLTCLVILDVHIFFSQMYIYSII